MTALTTDINFIVHLQGLIGWWMVRSGLNLDPEQLREIRVSPYRLATHLSMAFTTYTVLLWTGTFYRIFCFFLDVFGRSLKLSTQLFR